jgi:hypothetical protein
MAKKEAKPSAPADKIALYEKLIKTCPQMERKGATIPYTSLNGHMFSYLSQSGAMALRLPEDVREEFLKKYKTTLFLAYGHIQKEYVTVPDALLRNTKELKKYLALSYEHAKGMKPKPTSKKN